MSEEKKNVSRAVEPALAVRLQVGDFNNPHIYGNSEGYEMNLPIISAEIYRGGVLSAAKKYRFIIQGDELVLSELPMV